jgi:hypothetical protein
MQYLRFGARAAALILPLAFVISCSSESETQSASDKQQYPATTATEPDSAPQSQPEVSEPTPKSETQVADALNQKGNYASLFNRDPKNCDFVSREIIAEALETSLDTIVQGSNECTFHFKEVNGNSTRFYFAVETWGNKRILKEIQTAKENAEMFGPDSTLSQYKISDTGDTYLSMHQHRMVRILNETCDSMIGIIYNPKTDSADGDLEKIKTLKATAKDRTYKIANLLLEKHQE